MTHPNATPACTEAGHAVGGSWPLPRPGPAPLTAEPLWPASPRSPGTPTSPYTQEGEGGGRVSAGPARSGGGPGVGGWGYLQARRALPRGRPRPALQLCPAGKRRPSGPAARVPQPGAWPPPRPPRGRKSRTSSPFSPLDPARPGRPCGSEGRGQGSEPPHPRRAPPRGVGHWPLPWHGCASRTQGPTGEALRSSTQGLRPRHPCGARALTGSPLGPFSPGAPLRPASPCGRFGADVRPNAALTLPPAGRPRHTNLLAIESWHAVPAVPARHALATGDSVRPEGGPPAPVRSPSRPLLRAAPSPSA